MNLREVEPQARAQLLLGAARLAVPRAGAVYRAGDAAERVYFVRLGRLKLVRTTASGAESIVGIRAAGDVFGELAGFGAPRHATSALAIEALELDVLPAAAFRAALEADVRLARAFARGLARRLAAAGHELAELAGKSVAGRLVDGLGRLAAEYGVAQPDGSVRIALSLTQQDVADLIGSSRETVTKELRIFADVGLLRVAHKTVTLVQPQAFPFAQRRDAR